ncbi:MAG: hypothetical protein EA405_12855 [Rhodospirillales bacterium]|nr:MAG: hypothetical protein EA405_12855 [Rhodospirillales bacterium]
MSVAVAIAAALPAAFALFLAMTWRSRARHARQMRLGRAFARARRVQAAGTGEQGRPYSRYGPGSWNIGL